MALGVDTATEFFMQMEAILEGFAALERQVMRRYNEEKAIAEAKRDAVLNDPNATPADQAAAIARCEETIKEAGERAGRQLEGPRAASDAALRLLQAQARKTRARVDRLILCDHKLWKEASEHQRKDFSNGSSIPAGVLPAVIEAVDTFNEFETFLQHDRSFNELMIITQAIGTDMIIKRVTRNLDELSKAIRRGKPHTRVSDVVYLRPAGWTHDAPGEEQLRAALGAGLIKSEDTTILGHGTPLCYAARAAAGPGRDSALGYLAHAILSVDLEDQQALTRNKDYFVDDSHAGDINKKFVRFLIKMNPTLPPASADLLRKTALPRPDIVAHRPPLLEFEEFKSASVTGGKEGRDAVQKVRKWMKEYQLPYIPGKTYKPPAKIEIFSTTIAQYPIDFYLQPKRIVSGLVVYKYCIDADWKRLTWAGIMRVLGALLIYLLDRNTLPNPSPIAPPIQFPVPLPDPVPFPPQIPVPANLQLMVPASTVRALRAVGPANRDEMAQVVDDELIAL